MSTTPPLFRRAFSDTHDGQITELRLAIGECRALRRRHPCLESVEQTLRTLFDQVQGIFNRGGPCDLDGALSKVRGLVNNAAVGESVELARIAKLLGDCIEQRNAMEACLYTEVRS